MQRGVDRGELPKDTDRATARCFLRNLEFSARTLATGAAHDLIVTNLLAIMVGPSNALPAQ